METLAFPYPPWPDLPDHLLEDILELLPISGYVCFAAVCRRWRSVQTSHRRRHSPSPPPMLRLPWFFPSRETLTLYSPFEDRSFKFPFRSFADPDRFMPFPCGWVLKVDPCEFALFNPISSVKIQLPRISSLSDLFLLKCVFGVSPPPNYVVSAVSRSSIFLLRWFDSSWIILELPAHIQRDSFKQTVSISGKHYCIPQDFSSIPESCCVDLLVADALASPPTFHFFEMSGLAHIVKHNNWCCHEANFLVELDEEPLLVMEIVDRDENLNGTPVGFEVYRADLCRKMWVKVESIGCDRVLVISWPCCFSLLAADIGASGNCIYFVTGYNLPSWKVFDLGTGRMSYLQLLNDLEIAVKNQWLFVPALC